MPQSRSEQLQKTIKDILHERHELKLAVGRTRSELAETKAQTEKAIAESRTLLKAADAVLTRR
jgi:hypothetical protein